MAPPSVASIVAAIPEVPSQIPAVFPLIATIPARLPAILPQFALVAVRLAKRPAALRPRAGRASFPHISADCPPILPRFLAVAVHLAPVLPQFTAILPYRVAIPLRNALRNGRCLPGQRRGGHEHHHEGLKKHASHLSLLRRGAGPATCLDDDSPAPRCFSNHVLRI